MTRVSFHLLARVSSFSLLSLGIINWHVQQQREDHVTGNYDRFHPHKPMSGMGRKMTIVSSSMEDSTPHTHPLPLDASHPPPYDFELKLSSLQTRVDQFMRACMLVRNDNQLLKEWIAYHYTVLPLRHLIIGSDENSTEDPMDVLQLWNDTDLSFEVWYPEQYMRNNVYKLHNQHARYLQRQNLFLTKCLRYFHKTNNLGWVTMVDSDEYIKLNPLDEQRDRFYDQRQEFRWSKKQLNVTSQFMSANESMSDRVMERKRLRQVLIRSKIDSSSTNLSPGNHPSRPQQQPQPNSTIVHIPTVLDVLERYSLKHGTLPCHAMSRLRYSAVTDDNYTSLIHSLCYPTLDPDIVASPINISQLSTIRFLHHVPFEDTKRNNRAKVLIDLRRIPLSSLSSGLIRNPHKPLEECPGSYIPDIASFVHVNHYLHDYHVFNSGRRGDVREKRGMAEWLESAHARDGTRCDHIHGWLNEFVHRFGVDQAKILLSYSE